MLPKHVAGVFFRRALNVCAYSEAMKCLRYEMFLSDSSTYPHLVPPEHHCSSLQVQSVTCLRDLLSHSEEVILVLHLIL